MARFHAIQIWSEKYGKLQINGSSLIQYLDGLLLRAKTFKPEINLDIAALMKGDDDNYFIKPFKSAELTEINLSELGSRIACFNSTRLRIDCETENKDKAVNFKQFNFSFILSYGSKPSVMNFTFNRSVNFKYE